MSVDLSAKNGSRSLRLITGVLAGLLFQCSSTAFAQNNDNINPDRPGIADGSKVLSAGEFQIEAGLQKEHHGSGQASYQRLFFPALFRFGLDNRWEIRVEGNTYSRQKILDPASGGDVSEGSAPISLGAKYQITAPEDSGQPSIGVIVRVFPASGSGNFRTRHTTGDVRLAAEWDIGMQWSLNPNVGIAVYEDDQNRVFTTGLMALTLGYNASPRLNLFIDGGMQSREGKNGKSSVILDMGVAYLLNRDVQLDFSIGAGTAGSTSPRSFFSFGISRRF